MTKKSKDFIHYELLLIISKLKELEERIESLEATESEKSGYLGVKKTKEIFNNIKKKFKNAN